MGVPRKLRIFGNLRRYPKFPGCVGYTDPV